LFDALCQQTLLDDQQEHWLAIDSLQDLPRETTGRHACLNNDSRHTAREGHCMKSGKVMMELNSEGWKMMKIWE
tara:strand:+ start:4933 stop:5154 length:222 start_codon:yes stop_codon:yes gene_type:complete